LTPGTEEKTRRTSVRIARVPAEIRNQPFMNTNLERYRYANLLGLFRNPKVHSSDVVSRTDMKITVLSDVKGCSLVELPLILRILVPSFNCIQYKTVIILTSGQDERAGKSLFLTT
jgi:hypothetical protein